MEIPVTELKDAFGGWGFRKVPLAPQNSSGPWDLLLQLNNHLTRKKGFYFPGGEHVMMSAGAVLGEAAVT